MEDELLRERERQELVVAQLTAKVHNALIAGRGARKAPRDFVLTIPRRDPVQTTKASENKGVTGRTYFELLVQLGMARKD